VGIHFRAFFAATAISRALGYFRDLAIAHFIGGGALADLYFASFRLANFGRRLIGEGGLYAAYTPVYASILAKDPESARVFARAYASRLIAALAVVLGLGYLFLGPLTRFALLGYAGDPEKMAWAFRLTAILLPFLAFVVLAPALAGGAA
jgi:putative peptidoglycan lipid II flippase